MIKIYVHHEKKEEGETAIQCAEIIKKHPEINAVFVKVDHKPEPMHMAGVHRVGIQKRYITVVEYVGNCPRCGKEKCAESPKLADEYCHDCRMHVFKHG